MEQNFSGLGRGMGQNRRMGKAGKKQESLCSLENTGFSLVRPEGFEPPDFWSVARRSIQLS